MGCDVTMGFVLALLLWTNTGIWPAARLWLEGIGLEETRWAVCVSFSKCQMVVSGSGIDLQAKHCVCLCCVCVVSWVGGSSGVCVRSGRL